MGELQTKAESLGIDTDHTTKASALRRKIAEVEAQNEVEKRRATKPKATTTVRLHKHFKPFGWYNVKGYINGDEQFVAGQVAPPPQPGVHFEHKLWAGTVVELPTNEAQSLVEHADEINIIDRDPSTRQKTAVRTVKRRRQLAEVYVDWTKNAAGLEDAR